MGQRRRSRIGYVWDERAGDAIAKPAREKRGRQSARRLGLGGRAPVAVARARSRSVALEQRLPLGLGLLELLGLAIDVGREGLLEAQCDRIHDHHQHAQQQTGRLAEPQRHGDKAHGAAPVHGVGHHIEREARHHAVHQDAKVVAQVGARHAQCVHGRQHKHVARRKQHRRRRLDPRLLQQRMRRLIFERQVVQMVAHDTERKDGHGEQVAAEVATSAEQLGDRLAVVLVLRHNVPVERVEADAAHRDPQRRLRQVDYARHHIEGRKRRHDEGGMPTGRKRSKALGSLHAAVADEIALPHQLRTHSLTLGSAALSECCTELLLEMHVTVTRVTVERSRSIAPRAITSGEPSNLAELITPGHRRPASVSARSSLIAAALSTNLTCVSMCPLLSPALRGHDIKAPTSLLASYARRDARTALNYEHEHASHHSAAIDLLDTGKQARHHRSSLALVHLEL
ncbi:hypothetical protein L1887_51823 [Cichorium endivia]|nr:hypothetical protein L1887_51823 [Cichorium endivia]